MSGLPFSVDFIDSICRNLKASLTLNASLQLKMSQDGTTVLDDGVWDSIMNAHISTLASHESLIASILSSVEKSAITHFVPQLEELRTVRNNAQQILADARKAKDIMTRREPTHIGHTSFARNMSNERTNMDGNTHSQPTSVSATITSSTKAGKRKLVDDEYSERAKIPKTSSTAQCGRLIGPQSTSTTYPTTDTAEDMHRSDAEGQNTRESTNDAPIVEFYDLNAEVDEDMERRAAANAWLRKRERGVIEKRKRESVDGPDDGQIKRARTSTRVEEDIRPVVGSWAGNHAARGTEGVRKRSLDEATLGWRETSGSPKRVRVG